MANTEPMKTFLDAFQIPYNPRRVAAACLRYMGVMSAPRGGQQVQLDYEIPIEVFGAFSLVEMVVSMKINKSKKCKKKRKFFHFLFIFV
jgi:hypothetical protein